MLSIATLPPDAQLTGDKDFAAMMLATAMRSLGTACSVVGLVQREAGPTGHFWLGFVTIRSFQKDPLGCCTSGSL